MRPIVGGTGVGEGIRGAGHMLNDHGRLVGKKLSQVVRNHLRGDLEAAGFGADENRDGFPLIIGSAPIPGASKKAARALEPRWSEPICLSQLLLWVVDWNRAIQISLSIVVRWPTP